MAVIAGLQNEILSTLWQMERDGLIQPAITRKGRLRLLALDAGCDKLASDALDPTCAGNKGADLAPNAEQTAGAHPLESAPAFTGTTIAGLERTAEQALTKRGILARLYVPCPQEATGDCVGDGKHERIFQCDQCAFMGCVACLEIHESQPHVSDSDTSRELAHAALSGINSRALKE